MGDVNLDRLKKDDLIDHVMASGCVLDPDAMQSMTKKQIIDGFRRWQASNLSPSKKVVDAGDPMSVIEEIMNAPARFTTEQKLTAICRAVRWMHAGAKK